MKLLCNQSDFVFLEDYINSIRNCDLILYTPETPPFQQPDYYMCIRRIPFHLIPGGSKIGFINTEQLCVPSKYAEYLMYAISGIEIFDYSEENIRISGKGKFLPYQEVLAETEKLKGFLDVPKEYDFAVVGTPSEYRFEVIKKYKNAGFTINYVHGWKDERDKEIGKCRALLNIHYNSEYRIYESIRCNRWKFAGMPILDAL